MTVFDKMNELTKKASNDLRVQARHLSDNNWDKKINQKKEELNNIKEKLNATIADINM